MMTETVRPWYKLAGTELPPEDWQIVRIGDHFDFKNGLNKEKKFFGKGTPIVNYMDVLKNPAICATTIKGKVTVSNDELRTFEVRKGDVLFTRTSETIEEIGMSSVVIEDVTSTVFSGFLLRARPKTNLFELAFKKYCFRSPVVRRQITSTSSKTTRALTNGRLLSDVFVPIPSDPEEQCRIAESLSGIDELIEQLDALIAKKKEIKQGATQELVTGKVRLPGFKENWVDRTLGEIAEVQDGTHQTPKYVTDGVPFYSVENVTNDDFCHTKYISEREHRLLTRSFRIEKGDILMTRIGSIGDCKLIDWDVNASFYVSLALLKTRRDVSSAFVYQYSKSNAFRREAEIRSLQWAVPKKINLRDISDIKLCIPPSKEEQDAIAKVLTDIDVEIHALKEMRDKYLMIRKGMMQQLLTGGVRLP